MKPGDPRRPRSGLTLVEVLLALAILGAGLVVLVATASRCLAVARQAKQYETARLLLDRVDLENPLQLEEEIEAGTEEGRFEGDYRDYRWTRVIQEMWEEEEDEGLFQVTTRVSWSDRGHNAYEETVTFLYAPQRVGGSFERPAGEGR